MNIEKIKLLLKLSVQGMKTNKLRTILTTIGIIIGIAIVVIVLSAGRGFEMYIVEQVRMFGPDAIEVEIKLPSVSDVEMASAFAGGAEITTLKVEDFEAIKDLPNIDDYYAAVLAQFKTVYGNKTARPIIWATTSTMPEIDRELRIQQGRFFTDREEKSQAKVVVLGPEVKYELFRDENAIGKTIKINQVSFKVIGITEQRGTYFYMNFDKMIYMPLKTAQKQLMGIDHVLFGFFTVNDNTRIAETVEDMRFVLRRQHGLPPDAPEKDDFRVESMENIISILSGVTFGITVLVLLVGGISLVVGGVGIMNIMYLTVLERTREIGLRKSLGASNSLVLEQFLVEASLITFIGGVFGIILGTVLVFLIDWIANLQGLEIDLSITIDSIVFAILASIIFGILFGLYPARKASDLSPIDALRYE